MLLHKLGTDVLYAEIFPRLNAHDIRNLCIAFPKFVPYAKQSRDWDEAYQQDFGNEVHTLKGMDGYFTRLVDGFDFVWNFDFLQPHIVMDPGTREPLPYNDADTCRSFLIHSAANCQWAKYAKVSGRDYMYTVYDTSRAVLVTAHTRIEWQVPPDCQIEFTYTSYGDVTLLVNGMGIVEWSEPGPGERKFTATVEEGLFPEPLASAVGHQTLFRTHKYACVSKSGHVYMVDIDNHFHKLELEDISEVHPFFAHYQVADDMWVCSRGPQEASHRGLMAIDKQGQVWFASITGTPPVKIKLLQDIVKIVTTTYALLALSRQGKVYFMGSSIALPHGLTRVHSDMGGADLTVEQAFADGLLESETAVRGSQEPYFVTPRQVALRGPAVNISVANRQCKATVLLDHDGEEDVLPILRARGVPRGLQFIEGVYF